MARKPRKITGKKRKPMSLAHRKAISLALARELGPTPTYDPYEKKGRKPGKHKNTGGNSGGGKASANKRARAAQRRKNGPKTVESVAAKKLPNNHVSGGGRQADPDFLNKDAIRQEPGYADTLDMQREMVKASPEARAAFMNQVKSARKAAQIDHGPDPENGEYGRNRAAQRRALHLEAMAEDMGLIKAENTRRAQDQADAVDDRAKEAKKRNEKRREQGLRERKAAQERNKKQREEAERKQRDTQRDKDSKDAQDGQDGKPAEHKKQRAETKRKQREEQQRAENNAREATPEQREQQRRDAQLQQREQQEQALERAASERSAARRAQYANWDDDQLAEAHAAIMDKWGGDLDPANDDGYDFHALAERDRDRKTTADLLDEMDDRAAERAGYTDNRDYGTVEAELEKHYALQAGAAEQDYYNQIAGDKQAETELRDHLAAASKKHTEREAEYKAQLDKLTAPEKGDTSDEAKAYRKLAKAHKEAGRLSKAAKIKHDELETHMRETYPDYDRPFYYTDHEELTELHDALAAVDDPDEDTARLVEQTRDELWFRDPSEIDGWAGESIREMKNRVRKYGHDLTESEVIDRMAMAGNDRERVMNESGAFHEAYNDWLRGVLAEYARDWTHKGVVDEDPETFLSNLMYNNKNDGKNITTEKMLSNAMYARRASGEARRLFASLGYLPSRKNFMRTIRGETPPEYSEGRLREITTRGGKSDRRSRAKILMDQEISEAADAKNLRGRARAQFIKEEKQRRNAQQLKNLREQDEQRRADKAKAEAENTAANATDTTNADKSTVTTDDGREIDMDTIPGAAKDTGKGMTDRVKAILAAQAARRAESDTPESTAEKTARENGTTPSAEKAAKAVAKAEADKPAKRGRPKLDGPTLGEQRAEATREQTARIDELKANRPTTSDPARAQWDYDMADARLQHAQAVERFERDRMAKLAAQGKPLTSVKKNIDKAQDAQTKAREARDNALAKARDKYGDDAAETIRTTGGYVAPAKKKRTRKNNADTARANNAETRTEGTNTDRTAIHHDTIDEYVGGQPNPSAVKAIRDHAKELTGNDLRRAYAEASETAENSQGDKFANIPADTYRQELQKRRLYNPETGEVRDTPAPWGENEKGATEKVLSNPKARTGTMGKMLDRHEREYADALEKEGMAPAKAKAKAARERADYEKKLAAANNADAAPAAKAESTVARDQDNAQYFSHGAPTEPVGHKLALKRMNSAQAKEQYSKGLENLDDNTLGSLYRHYKNASRGTNATGMDELVGRKNKQRTKALEQALLDRGYVPKDLKTPRDKTTPERQAERANNTATTKPAKPDTGGKPTDAELADSKERLSRALQAVAGKPVDVSTVEQHRKSLDAMKAHADLLEKAGQDTTKHRKAIAKVEPQLKRVEKERAELHDYLNRDTESRVEKPTLAGYERTGLNTVRPIIERPTAPSPEVKRDRTDNEVTFKKLDVPESERIHGVDLSEWTVAGTDLNVGDIVTAKNNRGREQHVTITQIVSDDNGKQVARFEKTKPEDMPEDETADMSGSNGLRATTPEPAPATDDADATAQQHDAINAVAAYLATDEGKAAYRKDFQRFKRSGFDPEYATQNSHISAFKNAVSKTGHDEELFSTGDLQDANFGSRDWIRSKDPEKIAEKLRAYNGLTDNAEEPATPETETPTTPEGIVKAVAAQLVTPEGKRKFQDRYDSALNGAGGWASEADYQPGDPEYADDMRSLRQNALNDAMLDMTEGLGVDPDALFMDSELTPRMWARAKDPDKLARNMMKRLNAQNVEYLRGKLESQAQATPAAYTIDPDNPQPRAGRKALHFEDLPTAGAGSASNKARKIARKHAQSLSDENLIDAYQQARADYNNATGNRNAGVRNAYVKELQNRRLYEPHITGEGAPTRPQHTPLTWGNGNERYSGAWNHPDERTEKERAAVEMFANDYVNALVRQGANRDEAESNVRRQIEQTDQQLRDGWNPLEKERRRNSPRATTDAPEETLAQRKAREEAERNARAERRDALNAQNAYLQTVQSPYVANNGQTFTESEDVNLAREIGGMDGARGERIKQYLDERGLWLNNDDGVPFKVEKTRELKHDTKLSGKDADGNTHHVKTDEIRMQFATVRKPAGGDGADAMNGQNGLQTATPETPATPERTTTPKPETATVDGADEINGRLWEKNGRSRTYINGWETAAGFEINRYKTGNVRSAYFNGRKLSNNRANQAVAGRRVYVDNNTGELHVDGLDNLTIDGETYDVFDQIAAAIKASGEVGDMELKRPGTTAPAATPATGETRDRTDNVVTFRRINGDEWGVTGTGLQVGDVVTARNRKGREKPVTITEIVTDTDGKQVARFEDNKGRKRAPKRDAEQTGNNTETPARTAQAQPATPPTLPEGHDPYTGKAVTTGRAPETEEEQRALDNYLNGKWSDFSERLAAERELKRMGLDARDKRERERDAARAAYKPTAAEKKWDSAGLYFNDMGAWQTSGYMVDETRLLQPGETSDEEYLLTIGRQEVYVPAGGMKRQVNGKVVVNGTDMKTGKPVTTKSDEYGRFGKPLITRYRPTKFKATFTPQNYHAKNDLDRKYPNRPNAGMTAEAAREAIKRQIAERRINADPAMSTAPTITEREVDEQVAQRVAHKDTANNRVVTHVIDNANESRTHAGGRLAHYIVGSGDSYYTAAPEFLKRSFFDPDVALADLNAKLVDNPEARIHINQDGDLRLAKVDKIESFNYGYRLTGTDEKGDKFTEKISRDSNELDVWLPLTHENGEPYTRAEAEEYAALQGRKEAAANANVSLVPEQIVWGDNERRAADAALGELRKRGGELNFDDADEVDGLPDTPAPAPQGKRHKKGTPFTTENLKEGETLDERGNIVRGDFKIIATDDGYRYMETGGTARMSKNFTSKSLDKMRKDVDALTAKGALNGQHGLA